MNIVKYKKPDANTFRRVVQQCGGNLTKAAKVLGCSRWTVHEWMKSDQEFKRIVHDERMALFDECVVTARTIAMGIPIYEIQYDDNGEIIIDEKTGKPKKVFAGWQERPDGQMLRYMMSTLGRTEGFGESPVDESDGTVKSGVPIRAWIMKMNDESSD